MSQRQRIRSRQKQINILHTTTRKRHSQKQVVQATIWCSVVLAMIVVVGVVLHLGIGLLLDQVLYHNERYALSKIDIDPPDHFTPRLIRQQAGLELGENLWTLNLPQITHDLEQLPYVSNATVERHFPDRITIHIHERVPVVKMVGLAEDLDTRETFYLDRDGTVLKPRADEGTAPLPEIVGLTNPTDLEPGAKLKQPGLTCALQILDAIDHSKLHTLIDIRTIDLSDPLAITMTTSQDMSIRFQHDCIDQQLLRLSDIFTYADDHQRTLHTVDLTPNLNVPITFNP